MSELGKLCFCGWFKQARIKPWFQVLVCELTMVKVSHDCLSSFSPPKVGVDTFNLRPFYTLLPFYMGGEPQYLL